MNTLEHPQVFQSSDLSRQPKVVFDAAEHGDVEITRRDGSSLMLVRRETLESRERLLKLAGQLIAAATAKDGSFAEHLVERFPWMLALSPADRVACAEEVLNAARASFETGQAHLAVATLTSWEGTAQAIAAGLHQLNVDWLDDPARVERP